MPGSNHKKHHQSVSLGEWLLFLSQSSLSIWLMETEPARQTGILRYISQTPAWSPDSSQAQRENKKRFCHIFPQGREYRIQILPNTPLFYYLFIYFGWLALVHWDFQESKEASSKRIVYLSLKKKKIYYSNLKREKAVFLAQRVGLSLLFLCLL